jgi:N-acetyl-gamma-glutamylphosphate reductase
MKKQPMKQVEEEKKTSFDILADHRLKAEFDKLYKCSLDDIKPHMLNEGSYEGAAIKTRRQKMKEFLTKSACSATL